MRRIEERLRKMASDIEIMIIPPFITITFIFNCDI